MPWFTRLEIGGGKPSAGKYDVKGLLFSSSPSSFLYLHTCFPFLPPDMPTYSSSFLDSPVTAENAEIVMVLNTTATLGILLVEAGALRTLLSSKEVSRPTLIFTGLKNIKAYLARGCKRDPSA